MINPAIIPFMFGETLDQIGLSLDGVDDYLTVYEGGNIDRIYVDIETDEEISGDYTGLHQGPLMAKSSSVAPAVWIGNFGSFSAGETISIADGTNITYTTATIPAGRNIIEIYWNGSNYVVKLNGVDQSMINDGAHAVRGDMDNMDEMFARTNNGNYTQIKVFHIELDYPSASDPIYLIDTGSGTTLVSEVSSPTLDGTIHGATWIT